MKGCNAGNGPDVLFDGADGGDAGVQGLDPANHGPEPTAGEGRACTAARLALVRSMGEARFLQLAARVEAAFQQASSFPLCKHAS